ncbi:protein LEG1 homolog [Protopterus annectens]|uniref:protein LEG1 homolog n=1 Tax=Protopterus annectens TaxID=7888 RepID=UPI001CFB756D|nr:protein LEG1 homolog [Protopterus annectens]
MKNHILFCLLKCFLCLLCLSNCEKSQDRKEDGDYPPLWNLVPESLKDFTIQDNRTIINPWNYLQRMGLYKMLLAATAESTAGAGSNNSGNFLWGLALQHGWQFQTGRLSDPSSSSLCGYQNGDNLCISARSWWACMNYFLAVIPFLAAVNAGYFADWPFAIDISPPAEFREDFCYSVDDCQSSMSKVMEKWKQFFEYHKISNTNHNNVTTSLIIEEDRVLHYLWTAHEASIGAALPKCKQRLQYLSSPEVNFAVSWANAVEFIAATRFLTNFHQTSLFQRSLPHRMLTENDYAPSIPDFSAEENRTLQVLNWIYKGNYFTGGRLLDLWRNSMCTKAGKAKGRLLMRYMQTNPAMVFPGMFALLTELNKDCIAEN